MTMDKKVAVKNPNFKRMMMRKSTSKMKIKTMKPMNTIPEIEEVELPPDPQSAYLK